MKFCTKCGAKLPDNAMFCTTCGNKIEVQADPQRANIPERTVLEHIPEVKPQYAPQPQFMVQPPMMPTQVVNTAPVDDIRKHGLAVFGYKFGMFFSAVFSTCVFVISFFVTIALSDIKEYASFLGMNSDDNATAITIMTGLFFGVLGLAIFSMFMCKYNAEKRNGFKTTNCSPAGFIIGIVLSGIVDLMLAYNFIKFLDDFSKVSKYLSDDTQAAFIFGTLLVFATAVSFVNMFMSLCMVESARCKSKQ